VSDETKPDEPGVQPLPDPSTVGHMATAAYEQTLELEEERKQLRRTETWIFFRAFLILLFVIAVVIVRSMLL
jgi:hypothetical protein